MPNPLDFIKTYATYALLAVAAIGWAGWGYQALQTAHAERDTAQVRQELSDERAAAQALGLKTQGEYRVKEAADRARIQTQQEAYDALQKTHATTLAAHRATDDKLRNQISTYASGGAAPGNTCTAERDRAATLGVLLEASMRLQDRLAEGSESASDGVRTLKEAWPQPLPK